MMKVKFEFDKTTTYWNKEQGAGVTIEGKKDMGHWHTDVKWLNKSVEIESIKDVQSELCKILKKNYMPTDYFMIMDDGRISFNVLEDNDGYILNGKQSDELHENGEQVYLCDYSVYIEIQNVYEPKINELKVMFPTADF